VAILTFIASLLAPFSAAAPTAPAAIPNARAAALDDYGTLTSATQTDDGVIWLKLWQPYVRYRIPTQPAAAQAPLLALLKEAAQGVRAVTLRYDGGHGAFNPATATLDYALCSITLDERRIEPVGPCDATFPSAATGFVPTLSAARARLLTGDVEAALQLLSRLEMPTDRGARKLLLQLRSDAATGVSVILPPRSAAADRALTAVLADYRALAALDPDDADHQFAVAGALLDLGAYGEARSTYLAMLARWPNEEYRLAVRLGALHRVQGEYAKALQPLDDLVARKGVQSGMRFHYHRGWTLSLLGRYDEAIRERSEGLKDQPDYHSAYYRRACAWAALGDTRSAIADLDEAERLFRQIPRAQTTKPISDSVAGIVTLSTRLRTALAAGDARPIRDACTGVSWDRFEHPRPRSPLLPPAAS
jgi:hypothetical protein